MGATLWPAGRCRICAEADGAQDIAVIFRRQYWLDDKCHPREEIKKGTKGSSRKKKVRGQAEPTAERITEIQSALARNGAYTGDPTGRWDNATTEEMKKFQSDHGLAPTGKFDALTMQKLGLGSDTAGLGALTPPASAAVNRLLSPKVQRDEAKNEPE